jgi:elongation factor G
MLKACIRKGTVTGQLVPVFCGSSFKNKGVQQLLDAVIAYMPYPGENGGISMVDPDGNIIGTQEVSDDAPARALAFKVINDQFGTLTFARLFGRDQEGRHPDERHARQERAHRAHRRSPG